MIQVYNTVYFRRSIAKVPRSVFFLFTIKSFDGMGTKMCVEFF